VDTAKAKQLFFTEVEQLAASHTLVTLQTSYTKTDDSKRLFLNASVWMSISVLGMIFIIALVLRLTLPGPLTGLNNYLTAAVLSIIGIIILYGCFRQGLLNLRAYQYRNREQVHIYSNGMVYLKDQTANLAVRWDQIEELTRGDIDDEASGKVSLDSIYLTLTSNPDAEPIFFQPALPQCPEICAQVEQAYTKARLPALLIKYQQGEPLEFADLIISQMGISIPSTPNTTERDEFSWSQLEALKYTIEVDQPYTTIKVEHDKKSTIFKEFTCEIANANLLKALLATFEQ
jgi:hypothetical protein